MINTYKVKPTGRINRRDLLTNIEDEQVLSRENMYVVGTGSKRNKKLPGSDRLTTTSVGSLPVVWGTRYYTVNNIRKTFFFSGGSLYFQSDNGATTQINPTVFNQNAYPCSAQMRISSADMLYFSEGISTGMYSYDGNLALQFNKEVSVALNLVDMTVHLDRLWGFEEDSEDLYFSVNLDPTNFTDSSDAGVITIGAERGAKIQKIVVYNETLFIFKTDSIWALEGRTPQDFRVTEVHPDMGLSARRSLVPCENFLVGLMSDYEVYSFAGTRESMQLLTYDLALSGDLTDANTVPPIINRDRMDQVCAVYHNFLYRMSFVKAGETHNDTEYLYNFVNKTDSLSVGNHVACYIKWDRYPDKNELITGRSDIGRLMTQYRGLNWDNDANGATMNIKIQTKFIGLDKAQNFRCRRVWLNCGVLSAQDIAIKTYIDARLAASDSTSDNFDTQGETKNMTNFIRINAQGAITSRNIPQWNNSKCQNISFEIDENISDRDFEFESIEFQPITKNYKRSHRVRL